MVAPRFPKILTSVFKVSIVFLCNDLNQISLKYPMLV